MCVRASVYLVVLSVQQEVDGDEVVVVGWGPHVEDEAVDAVLQEGPEKPAQSEEQGEHVLVDSNGEIWKDTRVTQT